MNNKKTGTLTFVKKDSQPASPKITRTGLLQFVKTLKTDPQPRKQRGSKYA